FSSRRRHTRSKRDWSSDVCSSDLTIVPLYVIFVRLHWIGSLKPLIIPAFFGDAFSIFLLRQFFLTVPEELSDAARVDGANEWQRSEEHTSDSSHVSISYAVFCLKK